MDLDRPTLDRLSILLENLGSPHEFLVQQLGDRAVYHYTTLDALSGILGEGDLWLTNSRFSNDYEEGEHGRRQWTAAIAARANRADLVDDERAFAREVGEMLDAAGPVDVYVCCFCRRDDLLGQWRSYGANGTGVSLGLETDEFKWITGPDMPHAPRELGLVYLWRVFYNVAKQLEILDQCLAIAYAEQHAARDAKIELAAQAIRFFAPTFKNPDFEDEHEARLVFRPAAECQVQPQFRVSRGMLVPYYSLKELAKGAGQDDWRPPLTSVRIGPSANRDINRQSVTLLCEAKGYKDVTVEASATPYRG